MSKLPTMGSSKYLPRKWDYYSAESPNNRWNNAQILCFLGSSLLSCLIISHVACILRAASKDSDISEELENVRVTGMRPLSGIDGLIYRCQGHMPPNLFEVETGEEIKMARCPLSAAKACLWFISSFWAIRNGTQLKVTIIFFTAHVHVCTAWQCVGASARRRH